MSPRHGKEDPGLIERLRVQLAQVTAERDRLQEHLDARAELDRVLMSAAPAADGTGPIARVQGPRAAGHRAPRERRHLRVVPPLVIAACVALKAALKAAWIAHPAATAAAGAAGSAVILTAAIAVVPGAARAHEHAPGVLAPNPAASTYSATPIMVPSSPPSFAAFTRPRLDARSSASQPATVAPWCCYAPPPSSSPAAVPQPSVSSSPSPVSGIIQAVSSAVTVTDPTQDVQIPISATGGDTAWHAWVRGPDAADVTLTPAQGDLADGAAGYIDLAIDASAQATGGSVTVHIWPGDVTVVVTWAAVPVPVPSVVPSVVVTVAPTDSPSGGADRREMAVPLPNLLPRAGGQLAVPRLAAARPGAGSRAHWPCKRETRSLP